MTKVVDKLKVALAGEVGAADVDAEVGHARNEARVGDDADGRAVDYDIVKILTEKGEGVVERAARYEFRRVGRNVAAGQHVEVGRHR